MRSPAKHGRPQHGNPARTEEIWRAIARSVHLAEAELTPATRTGRPDRAAGNRAAAHLVAGRFLLARIADRHTEGARTRLGRAWRLRSFGHTGYAGAMDDALAYARAVARGSTPPPRQPALFQRAGRLPLLERFLTDRLLVTVQ
ncbi:hypothetical protein [[Kitasatospora] papulosa]|uniref:hypothetical protein n=1 Tax=[Kitasatospora] papulosa TaxID=1464011 RepID=UPI00367CAEC2